jgi:Skp family chaperone for outer membrane proteins
MRSKHISSCNKKVEQKWTILGGVKIHQSIQVKKKDILISTMVMRHLSLYAEDKYDITKDIIKALNDKYKAAAKTEEK